MTSTPAFLDVPVAGTLTRPPITLRVPVLNELPATAVEGDLCQVDDIAYLYWRGEWRRA